jgi:hypothetical protein
MKALNIRFLTQGMVKAPKEDWPKDLDAMSKEQVYEWAKEYLNRMTTKELLQAVAYLEEGMEDDIWPGAVEALDAQGEDGYRNLAETRHWREYWNLDTANDLVEEEG